MEFRKGPPLALSPIYKCKYTYVYIYIYIYIYISLREPVAQPPPVPPCHSRAWQPLFHRQGEECDCPRGVVLAPVSPGPVDWSLGRHGEWSKMSQTRCASRPNLTAQYPQGVSRGGETNTRVPWGEGGGPEQTPKPARGCNKTVPRVNPRAGVAERLRCNRQPCLPPNLRQVGFRHGGGDPGGVATGFPEVSLERL